MGARYRGARVFGVLTRAQANWGTPTRACVGTTNMPHVVGPQEPTIPQAPKVPQVPMVLLVEALQVQSRAMRRQRRLAWRSEGTLSEGFTAVPWDS